MKFHEDDLEYGKYLYAFYPKDKWAAYIIDNESTNEIHIKLLTQNRKGFFVREGWLSKEYLAYQCKQEKIIIDIIDTYEDLVALII